MVRCSPLVKAGLVLAVWSCLPACGRVVVASVHDGSPDGVAGSEVGAVDDGGDGTQDVVGSGGAPDGASDAREDSVTSDASVDDAKDVGTDAITAVGPTVVSTSPANGATGVARDAAVSATFSKAMDATTLLGATTFTVKQGVTTVAGVVTYDAATKTATFTPALPFGAGLVYTATITTVAKDLGGAALAAAHTWSFTTAPCGQAPVNLRSASGFVVLAGATVTNTGLSIVTGDLGVSPGTAITGFPPGTMVGAQHPGDPAAAQAIADLTTAYDDAKGRTLCPIGVAGDLSGQTLGPGLYKSTASLELSTGNLVLDGKGDANAVFIFQMATTLTTADGRKVMLVNGANAANVYWQVGTSATIGTTSVFAGTIMVDQAITLKTGATLNGRALARIAAVTLDSNVITKP